MATFNWVELRQRVAVYARLTRLHRPIGILLLLWPVLWALWIAAAGIPDFYVLFVFVAGTISMRAAGCVINDFADRDIDGHVKRTADRPLATGEATVREALSIFTVLVLVSVVLVLTMNSLTIYLSFIGIVLAIIYPFMKRYTYLPQIFLGAAFGWGVPMAFAAQTGAVPNLAWAVMAATVLWAMIYDTEYAMVDRDDDLKLGVKSTAILFEDNDRFFIGVFQILMLLGLLLIGRDARLGWPYFTAISLSGTLFIYQQVLIRGRERNACFKAFLNNNWVGALVFAGIALSYHLQY